MLRYLTVRVDELEEGPSAMMRKVERDRERDERGGGRFGDREAAAASAVAAATVSAVIVATGRRDVTATTIAAIGVR